MTPVLLLVACVLDRTGQSASEAMRREVLVHNSQIQNLQRHLDDASARLQQLEELTKSRSEDEILKMETMDELRREVASIRGDFETLSHDYGSTKTLLDDAQYRLAWVELRADQIEKTLGLKTPPPPPKDDGTGTTTTDPTAEGGTTEPPAEDPAAPGVTDPLEMMTLAEKHLAEGNEAAAEAVLKRFLDEQPKHERIAEARYRYAEAAFNDGRYQEAVLRFQVVIDSHKDTGWAPWAMLRQGEAFEKQGQKENAKLFYEDVVRIWPKSKAAKEAKLKL